MKRELGLFQKTLLWSYTEDLQLTADLLQLAFGDVFESCLIPFSVHVGTCLTVFICCRWQEVQQNGPHRSIPCKRYYSSSFCSFFGIQPQLLPCFAVLAGNDFVNLRRQDFDWTQYVPQTNGRQSLDELEGILRWIRCVWRDTGAE